MNNLNKNSLFLTLALCFMLLLSALLMMYDKAALHLMLNAEHNIVFDNIFRFYTLVAEYGVYVVAIGLLFYKAGAAAVVASSNLLSAAVTQTIKHLVNAPRPVTWFHANMPDVELTLVEGVRMNLYNSFPSGHTTAFFALALSASFLVTETNMTDNKKRIWQCIFFFLAALGGYSRIYLSQHFAADVLCGCLVGTTVTMLVCCAVEYYHIDEYGWWSWHISLAKH